MTRIRNRIGERPGVGSDLGTIECRPLFGAGSNVRCGGSCLEIPDPDELSVVAVREILSRDRTAEHKNSRMKRSIVMIVFGKNRYSCSICQAKPQKGTGVTADVAARFFRPVPRLS